VEKEIHWQHGNDCFKTKLVRLFHKVCQRADFPLGIKGCERIDTEVEQSQKKQSKRTELSLQCTNFPKALSKNTEIYCYFLILRVR